MPRDLSAARANATSCDREVTRVVEALREGRDVAAEWLDQISASCARGHADFVALDAELDREWAADPRSFDVEVDRAAAEIGRAWASILHRVVAAMDRLEPVIGVLASAEATRGHAARQDYALPAEAVPFDLSRPTDTMP